MSYLIKTYPCFAIRSLCDEHIIVVNVVVFINIDCFGCTPWKASRYLTAIIGASPLVTFV